MKEEWLRSEKKPLVWYWYDWIIYWVWELDAKSKCENERLKNWWFREKKNLEN